MLQSDVYQLQRQTLDELPVEFREVETLRDLGNFSYKNLSSPTFQQPVTGSAASPGFAVRFHAAKALEPLRDEGFYPLLPPRRNGRSAFRVLLAYPQAMIYRQPSWSAQCERQSPGDIEKIHLIPMGPNSVPEAVTALSLTDENPY